MKHILHIILAVCALMLLDGCQQQQQQLQQNARTPAYVYRKGYTAILRNGRAIAPPHAPRCIKRAIAAGNKIIRKPYRLGGGHRSHVDSAYEQNELHPSLFLWS